MDKFRASDLSQPANLRAAVKTGKTLMGVSVNMASIQVAKRVAITGYDWAFIDAEHAPLTPVLLADMIQTISFYSEGKMIPIVRVPSHEPSFISTALDAGAAGIILPHTETVEHAKYLVSQCRFPPQGKRSYPPWSWIPGINDHVPEGETISSLSNDHVMLFAQIESTLGVENAEDIIAVDGIDGVMIGIGDLRMDMGLKFDWYAKEPHYLAAVEKVENLSRKYNKPLLGFAFPEMKEIFEDRVRKGYQILMTASEMYTMMYGLTMGGAQSRATIAQIQETMQKEAEEAKAGKKELNGNEHVVNGNGHLPKEETEKKVAFVNTEPEEAQVEA